LIDDKLDLKLFSKSFASAHNLCDIHISPVRCGLSH
jgi:hypothetical protein